MLPWLRYVDALGAGDYSFDPASGRISSGGEVTLGGWSVLLSP